MVWCGVVWCGSGTEGPRLCFEPGTAITFEISVTSGCHPTQCAMSLEKQAVKFHWTCGAGWVGTMRNERWCGLDEEIGRVGLEWVGRDRTRMRQGGRGRCVCVCVCGGGCVGGRVVCVCLRGGGGGGTCMKRYPVRVRVPALVRNGTNSYGMSSITAAPPKKVNDWTEWEMWELK